MSAQLRRFAAISVLILSTGCVSTTQWPNWFHPGNTATQRTNAVYTDPYPLPDVGPPVVGGRPLGYQNPVPEVTRSRLFVPPPCTTVPSVQPLPAPPGY